MGTTHKKRRQLIIFANGVACKNVIYLLFLADYIFLIQVSAVNL